MAATTAATNTTARRRMTIRRLGPPLVAGALGEGVTRVGGATAAKPRSLALGMPAEWLAVVPRDAREGCRHPYPVDTGHARSCTRRAARTRRRHRPLP